MNSIPVSSNVYKITDAFRKSSAGRGAGSNVFKNLVFAKHDLTQSYTTLHNQIPVPCPSSPFYSKLISPFVYVIKTLFDFPLLLLGRTRIWSSTSPPRGSRLTHLLLTWTSPASKTKRWDFFVVVIENAIRKVEHITFPYRQIIPRGVSYRSGHPVGWLTIRKK